VHKLNVMVSWPCFGIGQDGFCAPGDVLKQVGARRAQAYQIVAPIYCGSDHARQLWRAHRPLEFREGAADQVDAQTGDVTAGQDDGIRPLPECLLE